MTRTTLSLALGVATAAVAGLATTAPAAASGGGVSCSFTTTATARVTAVDLPDSVRAGATVAGVVTIDRSPGATGPVEVDLVPSSWARTNACVIVPAGESSARFAVDISPVRSTGNWAAVTAYAASDGADVHSATSLILLG